MDSYYTDRMNKEREKNILQERIYKADETDKIIDELIKKYEIADFNKDKEIERLRKEETFVNHNIKWLWEKSYL